LDRTINEVWNEVEWSRNTKEFYALFAECAKQHYRRVGSVAKHRLKSVEAFQQSGYAQFKLK
jgi:hypothetical protein